MIWKGVFLNIKIKFIKDLQPDIMLTNLCALRNFKIQTLLTRVFNAGKYHDKSCDEAIKQKKDICLRLIPNISPASK